MLWPATSQKIKGKTGGYTVTARCVTTKGGQVSLQGVMTGVKIDFLAGLENQEIGGWIRCESALRDAIRKSGNEPLSFLV